MRIIALWGRGGTGKTATIRRVCDLLVNRWPRSQTQNHCGHRRKECGDIKYVLTIKGKKVGIESKGDSGPELRESLEFFKDAGCELIICAARARRFDNPTVTAVHEYRTLYDILWLSQPVENMRARQNASNSRMAKAIVDEAENIILA